MFFLFFIFFILKNKKILIGVLAALEHVNIPTPVKTVFASAGAAVFRVFLMPIDALKTTL